MKGQIRKRKIPKKKQSENNKLQSKLNNNLNPAHEYKLSDLTQSTDYETNNIPLTFIERLNKYSNLIVGIATVLLVLVTTIYIFLSWQIATETKRLADISIEQFKIKSYPTFLILRTNPTYTDGKYKDEIKIHNKGEIASHKTSFLIIYVIITQESNKQKQSSFWADWTYVYRDKDTENIDILDYCKNILPNSGTIIGIDNSVPDLIINNLKYQIVFIRHKVPYDSTFSYEAHVFAWEVKKKDKNSNENTFHWETLPNSRRDVLLENFFNSEIIAPDKEKKIIDFFVDYPVPTPLKFHIKKKDSRKDEGT